MLLRHHILLLLFFLFRLPWLHSQEAPLPGRYVQQAIATNHGLRQQEFLLEKNLLALEEAKKLFWPEVGFGATYTLAAGGRSIFIPVGDLVNPVYATLNQLLMSNAFPQIENEKEQFLPNNFYDARFRIRQPLVNREIYFNRKIKAAAISLKEAEIMAYRRELAKEVKVAYYRYLQAASAVDIYDQAIALLAESQRVNESLLRNDKIIPATLSRIQAEADDVKARQLEARNNQKNAAAYLNFLLNRPLDTAVETDSSYREDLSGLSVLPAQAAPREEMAQISAALEMNSLATAMKEAWRYPKLGLQVDLGTQNFDFEWGGYVLAGLSVEVPLWTAGRSELQTEQSRLDGKALDEQRQQLAAQLELQAYVAGNDLLSASQKWMSFAGRVADARRQYDNTSLRYREGLANYLELLDARSQLTRTALEESLALFEVLVKKAEMERVAGVPTR